ncbi:Uncharacterised protein [Legionella busanensis]|uniref:Uncharacterized protein n=1 Tax=Legionella busanensis TaxID=190655 RepID=A0A378JFD6_9GAMM|nr:hypothetical protein [Legionella busanensis]STX49966.1 Uncharacterised protein [Legionella busanensis]
MLYLIKGTSDRIYTAFGLSALLRSGTTSKDIEKDLFRTLFLGSKENCQYHINSWINHTNSDYKHYSQGNMSAGNLFLIFGPQPFFKENEELTNYYNNNVNLHFAFIDQNKALCGLGVYYRRDDPTKWMIGLIKHTNLVSNQRQICILTSVHPRPFIKNKKTKIGNLISITEPALFTALLEHPFLSCLINLNILPDGQINPNFEVIGQFLQNVAVNDNYQDNQQLLTTLRKSPKKVFANKALQVAQQLDLRLSIPQIYKCLDEASLLYQKICYLSQFKVTKARRWCDLLLLLDQFGLIEKWDLLIQNKLLTKYLFARIDSLQAAFLKNALTDEAISSLLFLIDHNEFAAFYEKINKVDRETEIIWRNLGWLTHLKEKLPNDTFKQALLCKLIFYIVDVSSFQDLINSLQGKNLNIEKVFSPAEFAQFLTAGFYTSHLAWQDIINLALLCQTTEQAQVCHSLFKLGFDKNIISSLLINSQLLSIVNNLTMFEINKPIIINFLAFLKNQNDLDIKSFCEAVALLNLNKKSISPFVEDLKKEQLFQLTGFIKKQKVALQPDLMKVAYVALTTGNIKTLQAELTQLEAKSSPYFMYQFINVLKIMNSLAVLQPYDSRKMVNCLVQASKENALFINVINMLEYECHKIRVRLKQELPDKLDKIEQEEKLYRRKMYLIIFKQINSPNSEKNLLKAIKEAEEPLLAIANIDYHPWLRCTLAIITNSVALLLTAGLANICHYKRSGDFFFFQHTASCEKIKALDINITEQLKITLTA